MGTEGTIFVIELLLKRILESLFPYFNRLRQKTT